MKRNGTNGQVPRQVAILFFGDDYAETTWTPRAIHYGGPIFPLVPGHGPDVEFLDNGGVVGLVSVLVEGRPYKFERLIGRRRDGRGWISGSRYRLVEGWQVLLYHRNGPAPTFKFPTPDRAEAETQARQLVTDNLSSFGTKLCADVVWQAGAEYGEPVARCDGHAHTRTEAAKARMEYRYLPLVTLHAEEPAEPPEAAAEGPGAPPGPGGEPVGEGDPGGGQQKAGEAATSPTDTGNADQSENPAEDYTTEREGSQVHQVDLVVRYQSSAAAVMPQDLLAVGRLVDFHAPGMRTPPARSLAEIRRWLKRNGYKPEYTLWTWLDRGNGPRRRREVWIRPLAAEETGPAPEVGPLAGWAFLKAEAAKQGPTPPLNVANRTTPEARAATADRVAADVERRRDDPAAADPFYRQTWTRGRDWAQRGGLGGS